jgi:hypothetical protein
MIKVDLFACSRRDLDAADRGWRADDQSFGRSAALG